MENETKHTVNNVCEHFKKQAVSTFVNEVLVRSTVSSSFGLIHDNFCLVSSVEVGG